LLFGSFLAGCGPQAKAPPAESLNTPAMQQQRQMKKGD
jgi:hypothetical protein